MFDALHESLAFPLARSDAERRLPWGDRLEAHVTPPTKTWPREIRTFPALQRCDLAEALGRILMTRWGREEDPQSPHCLLEASLLWLARSNPDHPLREPAVVRVTRPEVNYALGGVEAIIVIDADEWDAHQAARAWDQMVRIVDYALAQLARTEKGIRRRERRIVDPWGIVTRWGIGTLPDTRVLAREVEDGRQMELALQEVSP